MAGPPSQINSFISTQGAGRSPPLLIEDLTVYDPRRLSKPGRCLLRDPPINFTDADTLGQLIPHDSCIHEFWLKQRQSNPPRLDEAAGRDTKWAIAALCQRCRLHVQLKVDYTVNFQNQPCPNAERPLHHLIRSEWRETVEKASWQQDHPGHISEIYVYECSATGCSAVVSICLTPPEIHDQVIETLTDKVLLRQRTEAAFRLNEANTQGMRHPSPIDVLNDLRIYIRNAWEQDPSRKSIKLSNRRFMVRFGPQGDACKDVLQAFGFRLDEEGDCWHVPQPAEESLPLENLNNVFLDNVEQELLALIVGRPEDEHQHVQDLPRPVSALQDIARALGSQNYDKHPSSRTLPADPYLRPRAFTGLGIPQAAADSLVQHFYQYQISTDSNNGPSYLQFLKQIAESRGSELLQTEMVLEESKGRYDVDTLLEAHRYFGLDPQDATIDDDYVIGIFSSRLEDMRAHEQRMRMFLRIIGQHRHSMKIVEFADNTLNTYEQALQYLGANADYSDEGIQAIYAVKVDENKEQSQKAVRIIAKHRNSIMLQNWTDAGFAQDIPMEPAEGYSALQIDDRTCEDDLILSAYDVAIMDNPHSQDYYTRALTAIAKDRGSTVLRDRVQQSAPEALQASLEEPVGLENIGNTCYLNSLLQFLFTMVELRKIVLNFDDFKMNSTDDALLQKKVGQRKITKKEVQTAQKFVASLSGLFRGMIETPQLAIRPEKGLAKLTLETDNAKEKLRRRSTLVGDRPNLGHLDSHILPGPLHLPAPQINGSASDAVVQSPIEAAPALKNLDQEMKDADEDDKDLPDLVDVNDDSSEATLVSRPGSTGTPAIEIPTAEQQQAILDNKENLSPTKAEASPKHGDFGGEHPQPLAPASPSKINVQAGALEKKEHLPEPEPQPLPQPMYAPPPGKPQPTYAPPPGKPPPVPPRKPVEPTTDILEEYARQQDVTEVLAHCLFQFSCAMRPTGIDKSGEQEDEVHDMFFGQSVSHTVPEKVPPTAIPFFSVITRVVNEPRDVYEALDTEYDLSLREGGSQAFVSMSKLPPVFSIALDRVTWDKAANRPAKLNHHVDVPQRIFLDRYLETPEDSDLFQRRKQTWALKQELNTLIERRKILEAKHADTSDLPTLFNHARLALEALQSTFPETSDDPLNSSLQINPSTISTLGTLSEDLRAELTAIKTRISHLHLTLSSAFTDKLAHPYRLHAAFFHRGGAAGGHYWVYIYDHKKEIWRKYNDDRVTTVDNLHEIFGRPDDKNNVWASPNPYFLVYVREDEAGKIVESVKREIVWPPPDSSPPALPNRNNQSQMSHMPPDTSNGAYNLSDSGGYYEVEGQKVWIGDQYGEPQSSNRVEHAQNQDLMEHDQNPSLKQELEAREYKDYQNSKPAAFKTPRLSEMKERIDFAAPVRTEKFGAWDDSEADGSRSQKW